MEKKRMRSGAAMLSAAEWEEAALDLIGSEGLAAVSIPRLAAILGVTKGSFYWHFQSLQALVVAAVGRWEREDGDALQAIREIGEPAQRLKALFAAAMAAERAHALYLALAASKRPSFARVVKRVGEQRMQLLTDSYRELGLKPKEAARQAMLTYAAYIGGVHLQHAEPHWLKSKSDVSAYVEHAAKVLIGSK